MRLIDADALIEEFEEIKSNLKSDRHGYYPVDFADVIELVKEQPTVEARPVVRGEWLGCDMKTSICSECRTEFDINRSVAIKILNFCPNCGCNMGEKND